MKNLVEKILVVLGGGYGTRLGEIGKNEPKGLIDICGTTVLDRYSVAFDLFDRVVIATNPKWEEQHKEWADKKGVEVIVDREAGKPGEKGTLDTVLFSMKKIGKGDYFFTANDSYLDPVRDFFEGLVKGSAYKEPVIAVTRVPREKIAKRFGNPVIKGNYVEQFVEKPLKAVSDYAFMSGFYFPYELGGREIREYIEEFIGQKPELRDSTGMFVQSLIERGFKVRAFEYKGFWLDIGVPEDLEKARERECSLSRYPERGL